MPLKEVTVTPVTNKATATITLTIARFIDQNPFDGRLYTAIRVQPEQSLRRESAVCLYPRWFVRDHRPGCDARFVSLYLQR